MSANNFFRRIIGPIGFLTLSALAWPQTGTDPVVAKPEEGDIVALRDEAPEAGKTNQSLVDDQGAPLIPRKVQVATDYSQAKNLTSDARYMLLRGMVEALSQSRHLIRLGEPTRLVTINNSLEVFRGKFDYLVFGIFSQDPKTDLIKSEVMGVDIQSGVEIFRFAAGPLEPDRRFRNLDVAYWHELTIKANQFFAPIKAVSALSVEAQTGSVVSADGRDYAVGESGKVIIPTVSGRWLEVDVRKAGTYSVHQKLLIGDGTNPADRVFVSKQVPYVNPFYLDFGMIWARFPTARLGLPLLPDRLFVTAGFNFYGLGLKVVTNDNSNPALFEDLHLLELGGGINWYVNLDGQGRQADFRMTVGAEALLRINLQGKYVLDALTPVVVQIPIGLEFSLSREVSFYFQNCARYSISGDPFLSASAVQTTSTSSSGSSGGSDPSVAISNLLNAKLPIGPGVLEPIVPMFGLRLQL